MDRKKDTSLPSAHDELLEDIGASLKRFGGSKELLQKVLDTIPQTVFWKDKDLNYLGCNKLFAIHAGKSSPAELIGLSDFDLPWDWEEAEFYRMCDRRVMESGEAEIGIVESQINAEGKLTWLETNKVPLHNDEGEVIGILGSYSDITRLKQAEELLQRDNEELERRVNERTRELRFVADHDALTGLANRRHFVQRLNKVLNSGGDGKIALMFIDLDNFKPINDSDGHDAGDKLLVQVAAILRSTLGPFDFAGRFGGDEFLILMRGIDQQDEIVRICDEIRRRMGSQIEIDRRPVTVTASIGIVFCEKRKCDNCDTLLNNADLAMYTAKSQGKNNHCFFEESIRDSVDFEFNIRKQLVAAINHNQFVLHYQPIVDLSAQNRITGFEALVRWQHPERGLIPPLDFIPIAESTGGIIQLGQLIVEQACSQLARWKSNSGKLARDLKLNINLSPRQLLEPDFVRSMCQSVVRHSIDPTSICFEITESLMLSNSRASIDRLRELRKIGFSLYLDDFGTGYSSLNYLDELPVDVLKIDRSFVSKFGTDSSENAVVRMILALAETLNVGVIAEGVETEMQVQVLKSMNCHLAQGYFFAKPMPANLATEFLHNKMIYFA